MTVPYVMMFDYSFVVTVAAYDDVVDVNIFVFAICVAVADNDITVLDIFADVIVDGVIVVVVVVVVIIVVVVVAVVVVVFVVVVDDDVAIVCGVFIDAIIQSLEYFHRICFPDVFSLEPKIFRLFSFLFLGDTDNFDLPTTVISCNDSQQRIIGRTQRITRKLVVSTMIVGTVARRNILVTLIEIMYFPDSFATLGPRPLVFRARTDMVIAVFDQLSDATEVEISKVFRAVRIVVVIIVLGAVSLFQVVAVSFVVLVDGAVVVMVVVIWWYNKSHMATASFFFTSIFVQFR